MPRTVASLTGALLAAALLVPPLAAHPTADSLAPPATSWNVLPSLFYTPETRLAGGAAGLYFFRPAQAPDEVPSSRLMGALIYTQNRQITAALVPDLHLRGGTVRVEGSVGFARFPDTFYGIGNATPEGAAEDFTANTFSLELDVRRQLHPGLSAGPSVAFVTQDIVECEPGGHLASGRPAGSDGGRLVMLGAVLVSDTRDRATSAERGHLVRLQARWAAPGLGSDFDFAHYRAEGRRFVPLGGDRVLALHGLAEHAPGTIPFSALPAVGGAELLRGLFAGRFRDHTLLVAQAELRLPLWRWVGGALFAGAGEVAPSPADLAADGLHLTGGAGLRFSINRAERVNIRVDYGVGPDGSTGTYVTLGEAF